MYGQKILSVMLLQHDPGEPGSFHTVCQKSKVNERSTTVCNSEYFIVEFSSLVRLSVELSCLGRRREAELSCPKSESIKVWFRSSSNSTMRLSSSNGALTEKVLLEQQALQWALTCSTIQERNNS